MGDPTGDTKTRPPRAGNWIDVPAWAFEEYARRLRSTPTGSVTRGE